MSYPEGILPVVSLEDTHSACLLADLLLDAKVHQIEVVFRTAQAAAVIEALSRQFPELLVGAGTLRTVEQVRQAMDAGAKFFVSPYLSEDLLAWCRGRDLDYIPGVSTPTEAARAWDAGFSVLKVFPAEPLGGVAWLRALAPVLPEARWFPTGGISLARAEEYLALPSVVAVGVGEIARLEEIREGKWDSIRQRAAVCGKVNGRLRG